MSIEIRRRVTEWGNGLGIRLTRKEAAALGIQPGDVVQAEVKAAPIENDVDSLPHYHLGGRYSIDETAEEAYSADL
ncbi:MAG: AbrB/MazE/SpoVT family DNA-binding domain-containing protein [Thermoplasmatota archaeon]